MNDFLATCNGEGGCVDAQLYFICVADCAEVAQQCLEPLDNCTEDLMQDCEDGQVLCTQLCG